MSIFEMFIFDKLLWYYNTQVVPYKQTFIDLLGYLLIFAYSMWSISVCYVQQTKQQTKLGVNVSEQYRSSP